MIDYPETIECHGRTRDGDVYNLKLFKGETDPEDGYLVYELRLASGREIPKSLDLCNVWLAVLPPKAKFHFS